MMRIVNDKFLLPAKPSFAHTHTHTDTSDPSLTDLVIDERRQTIRVPVWITTDFHCPFSLVARTSLAAAAARYPHIELEVKWHPALLYTSLPQAGAMRRDAWLEKFFTSEQAAGIKAAHAVAVEKGRQLGLSLKPEPAPLVGSSMNAHRVAFQTLEQYGPKAQDDFVVSVYKAIQEENQDVGSPWLLAKLASRIGMEETDALQYLHTELDRELIVDVCGQKKKKKKKRKEKGKAAASFFFFSGVLGFLRTHTHTHTQFALLSRGGLEGKDAQRAPIGQVPQMNFKGKYLPVIGLQSPDTYAEV